MLAAQAESEAAEGLFVDALASLELALREEPKAPGRAGRRQQIEEATAGLDALFRSAGRAPTAAGAIAEWSRAEALYRSIAKQQVVFQRRLGDEVAAWAGGARGAGTPREVLVAVRHAQGRGANSAELSRLGEEARLAVAWGEYRELVSRAGRAGVAVTELGDGDDLERVERVNGGIARVLRERDERLAAEKEARLAAGRAEVEAARLVELARAAEALKRRRAEAARVVEEKEAQLERDREANLQRLEAERQRREAAAKAEAAANWAMVQKKIDDEAAEEERANGCGLMMLAGLVLGVVLLLAAALSVLKALN